MFLNARAAVDELRRLAGSGASHAWLRARMCFRYA